MHQPESSYNIPTTIGQESKTSLNHLADHLRMSRAAIAQSKLTLVRLRRCYSSARMRGVVDQLCTGMDAALSALERLDLGPSTGRTL
jgi:hypothetical protein